MDLLEEIIPSPLLRFYSTWEALHTILLNDCSMCLTHFFNLIREFGNEKKYPFISTLFFVCFPLQDRNPVCRTENINLCLLLHGTGMRGKPPVERPLSSSLTRVMLGKSLYDPQFPILILSGIKEITLIQCISVKYTRLYHLSGKNPPIILYFTQNKIQSAHTGFRVLCEMAPHDLCILTSSLLPPIPFLQPFWPSGLPANT